MFKKMFLHQQTGIIYWPWNVKNTLGVLSVKKTAVIDDMASNLRGMTAAENEKWVLGTFVFIYLSLYGCIAIYLSVCGCPLHLSLSLCVHVTILWECRCLLSI